MGTPTPEDMHRASCKVPQLVTNIPAQFGQPLQLNPPATASATVSVGLKDVVRWKGLSESDIQACRVYLGPHLPQPQCPVVAPAPPSHYAFPTPWTSFPPNIFDSMAPFVPEQMVYARISFGGGGVQHQAFVDWPKRGLLLQISAQYIQVDGVVTMVAPPDARTLPLLAAHIAPEPGGGDAVNAATFTYPWVVTGSSALFIFQAPPFARAFTPLMDRQQMINSGITQLTVAQLTNTTPNGFTHVWDASVGNDWPDDRAIPLAGNTSGLVVSVEPTGGGAPGAVNAGMMFHLDL